VIGNKLNYTRYINNATEAHKAHPLERFGREALRLGGVIDMFSKERREQYKNSTRTVQEQYKNSTRNMVAASCPTAS
jgi:predicted phage tail protein